MTKDKWNNVFSYHPSGPLLDRAEGIYVYDIEGNKYIDVGAGARAVSVGHGDPRVMEAISNQFAKFAYCPRALASEPRAELCDRIARVAPGTLNASHLCSGGSEAVEGAIKLAYQYHVLRGNAQKSIIISRQASYHGSSLGALSATGDPKTHAAFAPLRLQWPHIPQPSTVCRPPQMTAEDYALLCAQELERAIYYSGAQNVAAFIAAPDGAAAEDALIPPREYWQTIRHICNQYDVLLITDEAVTGFGRTGRWFCMEHFDVQADIMVTGKGISGAYAPLGAVTVSDEIVEVFHEQGVHFKHGYTSGGHPIACAAGSAVIDILEKDNLVQNSADLGAYLHSQKDRFLSHPTIAEVRGAGLLMSMRLVSNKETMEGFSEESGAESKLHAIALKHGLVLLPDNVLKIAPPLCITREQLDDLMDALDLSLSQWERNLGMA